MPTGLMTADDLVAVTGMKTSTKQAEWFNESYGVRVIRRSDGAPVITWETWEALNHKTYGISSNGQGPKKRLVLVSDNRNQK